MQKNILFIYLLFFFMSCESNKADFPEDLIDFALSSDDYFFLDSTDLIEKPWLFKFCAIAESFHVEQPTFERELNEDWHFALGNPVNGLKVNIKQKPTLDTIVNLPHCINQPNWPFWYERKMLISEDTYFYVNGDDGVQCFADEELLKPLTANYTDCSPIEAKMKLSLGEYFLIRGRADSILITVRVLNNALKGGLQAMRIVNADSLKAFKEKKTFARMSQELIFDAYQNYSSYSFEDFQEIEEMILSWKRGTKYIFDYTEDVEIKPPFSKKLTQNEALSFTAWGDSQGGWRTFAQLSKQMSSKGDLSIGLGDFVANGSDENQWQSFEFCMNIIDKTVFCIPGNHDYDGYYNDLDPRLYKMHNGIWKEDPTYFSWSNNKAFFLALDPNESFPLGINSTQRDWMNEQMSSHEWEAADWRFILIHQPPYSQGWSGYHGDEFIRNIIDSLAEEKRIDFVLSGHNHNYERLTRTYGKQKTHFLVLGGAGGELELPESSVYPQMDTVIKQHHYAYFEMMENDFRVIIYGLEERELDRF